jgi:hypothetical protein
MGRACSMNWGGGNAYRILVGKPRRRWVGNIKMDLSKIGWDGVDWVIWLRIGTSGGLL